MAHQEDLEISEEDVHTALTASVQQPVPMTPLELAIQKGADIGTIERLVALQEKMLARAAEGEFNAAMNRVQAALGRVATDLENSQTHSKYASYAALDRAIRPVYSKEGFSLSFDTGDAPLPDMVRVLCYVSHSAGHTRTYKVDMPADGKGARGGDVMTRTHATGAAMQYGMRYLYKYVFNVAIGAEDNDGNGVTMGDLAERLEWIENCHTLDELKRVYTSAFKEANASHDQNAMNAIVEAKNKKRKELQDQCQ